MSDSNEEKNVEELLSQLQGIFGKLSSDDKNVTPPAPKTVVPPAAPITPPTPVAPPTSDPFFIQPPDPAAPAPMTPVIESMPEPPPLPQPPLATPIEVTSAPVMPAPETPVVFDASTIGCAVYYPLMREKEAKILAEKIETMTPKFTKLAFKLKVGFIVSYDPRAEWREPAMERVRQNNMRALFLLTDRAMDDAKKRAVQNALEQYLIYFQEVPILSLEKKAFFTDVLLGMVFFFDTMKPKPAGE